MPVVYLCLGSNLGDRRIHIKKALALISERAGKIHALSDFRETQPWGYHSQKWYLNVAVAVETKLTPEELLTVTQEIELHLGRREKTVNSKYRDRVMDIDILLYGDLILQTPSLTVPHPLMHQRTFVLQPLSEIAPSRLIHPVLGKTVDELLQQLYGIKTVEVQKSVPEWVSPATRKKSKP